MEKQIRLTITSMRIMIEKKAKLFDLFGKQRWASIFEMDIKEPVNLSLDRRGKHVIIKGGEREMILFSKSLSAEKFINEIKRNISIAKNIKKNEKFSSRRIIDDLRKRQSA